MSNIVELKKAFCSLGRALMEVQENAFKALSSAFDYINDATNDAADDYHERKNRIVAVRASWFVLSDTRRQSQVMLNKPRYLVRKIIN